MNREQVLQVARFLVVGVFNTGFSYAVYAVLLWVGLNFVLANLVAVLLGILFSFRTQGRFVFRNTDKRLIFRFAGCWGAIFLINIGLIALLMRAGLNSYWAGAVALVPITVISYFAQKVLVFGPRRPIEPAST